jgi:hypothetical protein
MNTKIVTGVVLGCVLILGGILYYSTKNTLNYETMTAREVALTCTTDMATQYHIHPELTIIAEGKPILIPADVGITNGCMNSLHTHTPDGVLHVESPVQKDFVLGDFFAVWKKDFNRNQILDFKTDSTHAITVTVNGVPVDTFENTPFRDLDKIVITYK